MPLSIVMLNKVCSFLGKESIIRMRLCSKELKTKLDKVKITVGKYVTDDF